MTVEERVSELESWYGILEVEFGQMWARIDQLVGRPTMNTELIYKEALIAEIRGQACEGEAFGQFIREHGDKIVAAVVPDAP